MQWFWNKGGRALGMVAVAVWGLAGASWAQAQIYRCGNEYTNNPGANAKARGCKLVEGGNLTVVEGFKPKAAPDAGKGGNGGKPAAPAGAARNGGERVDSAEQRARDSDARAILEAELRKAEGRLADLRTEYNNGEPDKRGDEFRNHQRYLDRVDRLKGDIARAEADVAGLKRELARGAAPSGR